MLRARERAAACKPKFQKFIFAKVSRTPSVRCYTLRAERYTTRNDRPTAKTLRHAATASETARSTCAPDGAASDSPEHKASG
jgi:hypothetical protein